MGRHYDNWERLVEAVLRREQIRRLCLAESRSPSMTSRDSDFSRNSSCRHDNLSLTTSPSPLQTDVVKLKLAQSVKGGKHGVNGKVLAKTTSAVLKGLSIFSGFYSKKENGREERETEWARAQRTLRGHEQMKNYEEEISLTTEMAKRRDEIARVRELYTLKGHIESLVKRKGLNLDSIHHNYTV